MPWSAKFKINGGIGLALAILIGVVALSWRTVRAFGDAADWVLRTQEVRIALDRVISGLKDTETGAFGYVATGDERFLAPYTFAAGRITGAIERLGVLVADNPDQKARLAQVSPVVETQRAGLARLIEIRRTRGMVAAQAEISATHELALMADIRAKISAMRSEETRLLSERIARAHGEARLGLAVLASGLAIDFALLAAVALIAQKDRRSREQAAAEIMERTAQLTAANQELEAFTYSVSHDLRAPIRHIDGFAQLLKGHCGAALDGTALRFLSIITDSAKQMGTLIDALLVFSRMGRAELKLVQVPMDRLVEEVLRELKGDLGKRSIDWRVGSLPEVRGDPTLLRQVWANLIGNAIKYTQRKPEARIEIDHDKASNGEHVFFVRDNGAGFDMTYAHKLFGVFQRLHDAREFEGTGIGLANVRRIVHRHGGRTWAEGRVGEGATFYFSLPSKALSLS